MEEENLSVEEIKGKSVKGVVVLTGRTFVLQAISLLAQLLLFAYLNVSDFGVFAIVSAVVNFLTYFSDIGLAAALIQKKESPSEEDLKTTFTVQQSLVLILVIILFLCSPLIINHYSLDNSSKYLIYALGISLILTSLKSIPSVLLERKLEFIKLVFPQILETLVYNIVLVVCAMKGLGITSFSVAVLSRSVIGLTVIYLIQPWKPGFAFSLKSLKELFKFGVPYQLNTFLATVKDDGITIALGSILGPAGVGLLSFAQKVGRMPLTFFMDTVTKVTFPAFSRLQGEKRHLERSVTRSIFFICLLVFPSLAGLAVLMPVVVKVIPRYQQWDGVVLPFVFIAISFSFAAATTQLTNLLNAIGKIKITFYLMIMWTVLSWILIPILSRKFGVLGSSIGYALVSSSSLIPIYLAKKYVNFSIFDSMVKPILGTMIMTIVLLAVRKYLPTNIFGLEILVLVGIISYSVSMVSIVGLSLLEDAQKSFKTIFNRN